MATTLYANTVGTPGDTDFVTITTATFAGPEDWNYTIPTLARELHIQALAGDVTMSVITQASGNPAIWTLKDIGAANVTPTPLVLPVKGLAGKVLIFKGATSRIVQIITIGGVGH
jgi:hypothetical protein